MYSLLVRLPLVGSLLSATGFIFGTGGGYLATRMLMSSFVLSVIAFLEVGLGGTIVTYTYTPWIVSGYLDLQWGFLFDSLTVTILVVVTGVSSMVHLYSLEYMGGDPHLPRFISYLSLFTFFMLVLVTGDNLLQRFLGWEGIGLSSYLLINFWFTRLQANKAAIKAMLVNRVGDIGLALAMLLVFIEYGTLNYSIRFSIAPYEVGTNFLGVNFNTLNLLGVFLRVGTAGKSAQLGLHTWLPDAMEGPTPVSARIHAATLVTAGVFRLARISPIIEFSTMLPIIAVIGGTTALFAATTGLLQNDIKRVIAYSTCSQLGYIVFACGVSAYSVGVFHLANHAFFKALLFLSAGSVIHAMSDEQDIRRMGGLVSLLPFSYAIILIGSLALIGFPYLTGFYSKDVILEVAYGSYSVSGQFAYVMGTMAAFFTAFYSNRLLYLTFRSSPNGHKSVISGVHDAPVKMALPLVVLSFGAIFIGYLSRDRIIGLGTPFWEHARFTHPDHLSSIDGEFLPHLAKVFPTMVAITGALLAILLYHTATTSMYEYKVSPTGVWLYTMLNRKWMWDKMYGNLSQSVLNHGYRSTYLVVDRGVIESCGPLGLTRVIHSVTSRRSFRDSGSVQSLIQRTMEALFLVRILFVTPISMNTFVFIAFIVPLVYLFIV